MKQTTDMGAMQCPGNVQLRESYNLLSLKDVARLADEVMSRTKLNISDLVNPPLYSSFGSYARAKLASIIMTLIQPLLPAAPAPAQGREP
jgi:hypothetical protein